MSVTSLLDRMTPFCQGWTRTGTRSLITLIQEGQDEILDYDSVYMLYIGTGNQGFPPYLKTTAGTYRYSINNTNLAENIVKNINGTDYSIRCKRVMNIFVDVSRPGYDYTRRWLAEPYVYNFRNPYAINFSRTKVANVPVKFYPCLENTEAYIEFIEDPGTSTDKYFCNFIWESPRLISESIPLVIPSEYEAALEDYVIGKVTDLENGRISERTMRFRDYWIPRFREKVTDGVQTSTNEIMPIYC